MKINWLIGNYYYLRKTYRHALFSIKNKNVQKKLDNFNFLFTYTCHHQLPKKFVKNNYQKNTYISFLTCRHNINNFHYLTIIRLDFLGWQYN